MAPKEMPRLLVPAIALLFPFVVVSSARAADSCSYDLGTLTISVSVSGISSGPPDNVLRVDSAGSILFEGVPCGAGTTTATDTIVVTGSSVADTFFVDLGGGPFAPSASPEADGLPEIEIGVDLGGGSEDLAVVWGTGSADSLVAGQLGADFNGDMDGDVFFSGAEDRALVGFAGNDSLRAVGGEGIGGPVAATITLFGLDG
jgi:hypothetical protein